MYTYLVLHKKHHFLYQKCHLAYSKERVSRSTHGLVRFDIYMLESDFNSDKDYKDQPIYDLADWKQDHKVLDTKKHGMMTIY